MTKLKNIIAKYSLHFVSSCEDALEKCDDAI